MALILDNIIFDLQRAGGISKVWAKHLDNINVSGISARYIESDKSCDNLFRKNMQLDQKFIIKRNPIFDKISRYQSVSSSDLGGKVFHSSYFRNPTSNMAVVHTVHDFMYELFDSGIQKQVHILQKKAAMKRADVIVCVSEHTKADMYKLYPWTRKKKVKVIYNGADSEFHEMKNKEERLTVQGVDLKSNSFLLYVGSRGYCKNFPVVLKLLMSEYSCDNHLKLICVGGGGFSESEIRAIQGFGLEHRIHLFNDLESNTLNSLYNYALALLMPSIYEGFGIPALEAAKAGCIVVGANNTTLPEILGNNDFLFSPFDYKEAYSSFSKLSDTQYMNQVRVNVKNKVDDFTWEQMTHDYISTYKELGL